MTRTFPAPAHISLEAISATSEVRKLYPRDFFPNPKTVRLPLGKTTYWLLGPESGPKVVLVHGISTPSILWKYIAPFLAENGLRVLVYDLFGRGYSEAPEAAYDANLYITQLALLLQHVRFGSAHIVGLSMGGGVAAAFAAMFPDLVTEKVVFLASAGLMELPPAVSQVTTGTVAAAGLGVTGRLSLTEEMRKLQTACLPGYAHALASSMREGPLTGLEYAFKAIAETPRLKCLILHGTSDGTVGFGNAERMKGLMPGAELVRVEGADHDFTVAEGYYDDVRRAILGFLQG